jgi:hypothetical protein
MLSSLYIQCRILGVDEEGWDLFFLGPYIFLELEYFVPRILISMSNRVAWFQFQHQKLNPLPILGNLNLQILSFMLVKANQ